MEKFRSLAEALGTLPPVEGDGAPMPRLEDITDSKAFAKAVLESREFRQYIVNGLTLGDLPSAILCRLMDYGWGKPVERVEHSGPDGQPIETVAEVRRVVVHVTGAGALDEPDGVKPPYRTH